MESRKIKIALIGNPNSGKSTLFNALTGLKQKVANFPGVTVEKKTGTCVITHPVTHQKTECEIIDLPGTYSLYPKSLDERIPFRILCDPLNELHPDLTIVIADASNLKRSLFLCSQIVDLKSPAILALNMMDIVEKTGTKIDIEKLSREMQITIVPMNARKGDGVEELKNAILEKKITQEKDFLDTRIYAAEVIEEVKKITGIQSNYHNFLLANNINELSGFQIQAFKKIHIAESIAQHDFDTKNLQALETLERYKLITEIISRCVVLPDVEPKKSFTRKIDNILSHRIFGYLIFLFILFLIFQAIFAWASYPMDLVDNAFKWLSSKVGAALPPGLINNLVVSGILAGLNGIVIFVPQIALLFTFIAILEDTGYMSRVSFLMDKLMRKFGLNGRSVIPLISGVACAVPAIMSTRTIKSWKQRLITIMVTPLMSCSARLPVYTLLISMIVPAKYIWGINEQGLVLMAMYLIGFFAAIITAMVLKFFIRAKERDYYVMELPMYRMPRWDTIGLLIIEKVRIFLFDAGKVIIAISIILWALSSFGPGNSFEQIETKYKQPQVVASMQHDEIERKIQTEKLEASYAGHMGRVIEPAIKPLGFDWKIGIALITSFAAREVFVGTMSTIYSVGDAKISKLTVRDKMMAEKNPETGLPVYTFAVGFSLMLFYAFAMQCMSTVAVVRRETKSWKWTFIQIFYMSAMAYFASLIAYQLLKP